MADTEGQLVSQLESTKSKLNWRDFVGMAISFAGLIAAVPGPALVREYLPELQMQPWLQILGVSAFVGGILFAGVGRNKAQAEPYEHDQVYGDLRF